MADDGAVADRHGGDRGGQVCFFFSKRNGKGPIVPIVKTE